MPHQLNYLEMLGVAVYQESFPLDGERPPDDQLLLYTLYGALVQSKGVNVTASDVHDAWSIWQATTMPEHRSIKPFGLLAKDVQEMDNPFVDAIRQVARDRMPDHDASLAVVREGDNPAWILLRTDETAPVFHDCPDEDISIDALLMSHLELKMFGWGVQVVDCYCVPEIKFGPGYEISTFSNEGRSDVISVAVIPVDPDGPKPHPYGNRDRQLSALADDLDATNRRITEHSERLVKLENAKGVITVSAKDAKAAIAAIAEKISQVIEDDAKEGSKQ